MNWKFASITVACAIAFAPLLISVQTRTFWPVYFALASIIWLIISEQYFETKQRSQEFKQNFEEVVEYFNKIIIGLDRTIADSTSVILFDNCLEAREYIKANAPLARSVYNTRIGDPEIEENDPVLKKTKANQDDAIKEAVLKGTNYYVVFDEAYKDQRSDLIDWANKMLENQTKGGRVITSLVKAKHLPLIQFTILEYVGRKEVLVGWVVADNQGISQEIFLVRSDSMAKYFIELFNLYTTELKSE